MIHQLLKLAGLNVIQNGQNALRKLNELLCSGDPVLFFYYGFDKSDFKPVFYINKKRFPSLSVDPEIFIFSDFSIVHRVLNSAPHSDPIHDAYLQAFGAHQTTATRARPR